MTADLIGRINDALDGTTPGPWGFVSGPTAHIVFSEPGDSNLGVVYGLDDARLIAAAPVLLREAAEQLAAKDAELADLKASLVELQPSFHMACVPHCPVLNGYSGKHYRECRPVREA